MCKRDRNTEKIGKKWAGLRIYLSHFLSFSHTDKKNLLSGLNHTFEHRNWVHTGQMWHIILCDLIIRLLPQHSYTTSVFHYRGRRGGTEWAHHEESVTDPDLVWMKDLIASIRHLSGSSSCFSDGRKEVYLCTGSLRSALFPRSPLALQQTVAKAWHIVLIYCCKFLSAKYSVRPREVATLTGEMLLMLVKIYVCTQLQLRFICSICC